MKNKKPGPGSMKGRTDYTPGNKVAAEAARKKRGGALRADYTGKNNVDKEARSNVYASGGKVGSDKSPFSSAGGGKASTSPFSSACRK